MGILDEQPSQELADSGLIADGVTARDTYDSLQSPTKAAAGGALMLGLANPALLPVGIAAGAMGGQFDNMGSAYELTAGTSIGTAWDAYNQISSGDYAAGIPNALIVGADVVGAIGDPIAAVAGQLVGWMMEHLEPLRMVLHGLTGEPAIVQGYADTWDNIAKRLEGQYAAIGEAVNGQEHWKGDGADAYRKAAANTQGALSGAYAGAMAVKDAALKMKDVVASVRNMVRDILADLAGSLVSAAVKCLIPPLAVTAIPAAISTIAKAAMDIAGKVSRLALVVTRLIAVLIDLGEALNQIEQSNGQNSGSVQPKGEKIGS
ncbi:hypothetical protein [Saccharomonospora cyanea]|uniref:ESX-1 secretion-associated protein EspA/EspE-like domain-containing protein n=1 Tax=Saccharomonospora cyanea NA-134 TaxID=882082 RepID=H5XC84_9PSEU|nr:hypothetical protein [Saccharomonospora cyanea]EHR59088.1 hypothetical protein SaccyDRAFT_0148 [Saccharomonospora cyanea NA-134]